MNWIYVGDAKVFSIERCLPHKYKKVLEEIDEEYFNTDIDLFAINNEYYVLVDVCYNHTKVICFGMIRGWDKDEFWDEKVLGIWTDPEWRCQGYATIMMHWLEFIAKQRNLKSLRLHVDPKNKAGIALYNKMGYIDSGQKFRFMNIMRKSL